MKEITQISSEAKQKLTFVLADNTSFVISLEYRRNVSGWYFDIIYTNFALFGQRLCNHPNILRQFQNILPFGLFCYLEDGTEPLFIDDFSTGRAQLFVLDQSEVELIEATLVINSNK